MKRSTKILFSSLFATAAVTGSTSVMAQVMSTEMTTPTTPWYVGASLGQSRNRFEGSNFSANNPNISESTNETDTGGGIYAGYKLNSWFALQGGYTDFGKFDYHYNGVGPLTGIVGDARYRADSVHFEGVATLPIANRFSAFGEIGIANTYTRDDFTTADTAFVGTSPVSTSTSRRTTPLLGVGLNYDLNGNLAVRAQYEDYGRVGDGDTGHARESLTSVGLKYSF